MKRLRTILYTVAIISAVFACFLSFESDFRHDTVFSNYKTVAVDSGIDGGAAGFAILAGLALVAASITHLKKEER